MQLETRQAAIADALLNPELPAPAGLVGPTGEHSPKRFAVYRNNVTVSLVDALSSSFPTVRKIVGEEFFAAMAREFVRRQPPTSPLLMYYGEAFPRFLQGFEPVAHLAYLPEVAQLEQYRREAYHAADVASLPSDFLGSIAPDQLGALCVTLHPSTRLLDARHPALSVWEWNAAQRESDRPAIPGHGEAILVARPEMTVETHRLPPGCYRFLGSLAAGECFGTAAEAGLADPAFDLAVCISSLLESRIVTDFTLEGAQT